MTSRRVVVGSAAPGGRAGDVARGRRDAGQEVVLLGDGIDTEHLGRAVVAEDAGEVVVVGSAADADRLRTWLADHDLAGVVVTHEPV